MAPALRRVWCDEILIDRYMAQGLKVTAREHPTGCDATRGIERSTGSKRKTRVQDAAKFLLTALNEAASRNSPRHLAVKRIVRGREEDCRQHYAVVEDRITLTAMDGSRA